MLETDVLIVGSGPAGSACALLLTTYGVHNILVTKYRWIANTPRAHITNQRTMEILRDLGIEDGRCSPTARRNELMGDTVFCTSLAGEEIGRMRTWGTHPRAPGRLHAREPDRARATSRRPTSSRSWSATPPTRGTRVALRHRVPLATAGRRRRHRHGARPRHGQRVHDPREVPDRRRRRALARSPQDIGLPYGGPDGRRRLDEHRASRPTSRSYVEHRPSVLYWVLQPGSNVGGIGMGLVRMVRPWNEWLIVWGYDINEPPPEVDDEAATRDRAQPDRRRTTIPIKITLDLAVGQQQDVRHATTATGGCSAWATPSTGTRRATAWAPTPRSRTPTTWPGSSRWCCGARPAPSLLDTYDAERAPIGRQIVAAGEQEHRGVRPDLRGARACSTPSDAGRRCGRTWRPARRDTPGRRPSSARKLREAIELKNYEFNAHGVEMGQRYASAAVVPDGTPEPAFARDPELYYHPTTWPGARLPHVWLGRVERTEVSTHDLAGKGRFALLTGIGGEAWVEAAQAHGRARASRSRATCIGPGRDCVDHLRRLGARPRGRRGRLRARAPRRARRVACGGCGRRGEPPVQGPWGHPRQRTATELISRPGCGRAP